MTATNPNPALGPRSTPKHARVVSIADVAPDTRHLTLQMVDPPALDFVGGQYVIVDSGIVLPSGKAAKRAYSILSADSDPCRFELAVMRLPGGPGSGFLHDQAVGAPIRFSGPWGKLHLNAALEPEPRAPDSLLPTLLLATDTGVTALLGLARGRRFAPLLHACRFIWLRTASDYFLPESFVLARLPAALRDVHIADLTPIDHPARAAICRRWLRDMLARAPLGQAFLAGDGAINYALLDDLVAAGVPATRDSVESFFNMPKNTPKTTAAP
jgi:ferredoxin-NADP reductase